MPTRSSCLCGCGRSTRPGYRYARGHSSRTWTYQQDAKLSDLIEAGLGTPEIAKKLKRTTHSVRQRRAKLQRTWGGAIHLSMGKVGEILGISETAVSRLRRQKRLPTIRPNQYHYTTVADLEEFIRNRENWGQWRVEDMPPGHWRDLAEDVVTDRVLSVDEAGDLIGICGGWVSHLISKGRLKGIVGRSYPSRKRAYMVLESDARRYREEMYGIAS